jgi:fibronectin type 3 domain-containing protein
VYASPINIGNTTSYTVANLGTGNTYYFVVTSYDAAGNESAPSNEVSKVIY